MRAPKNDGVYAVTSVNFLLQSGVKPEELADCQPDQACQTAARTWLEASLIPSLCHAGPQNPIDS